MTRKRTEHPAAAVAAQDENQADEMTAEPPGDLASPAELAALAEQIEAGASQDMAEAEQQAREIGHEADLAEQEGRRLLDFAAEQRAKAQKLHRAATERTGAERERAGRHARVAARQAEVEKAERQASNFSAERERLTETIAGLDDRLAALGADRERLEAAVAAARVAGDASLIAEGRRLLDGTVEAIEALGEQHADAMALARPIGDGTESGPGLLLDALTAAEAHRRAVTVALDELYPDRPGAERRRDLANLKDTLAGNMARIAEEAKAEPTGRRRYGFAGNH